MSEPLDPPDDSMDEAPPASTAPTTAATAATGSGSAPEEVRATPAASIPPAPTPRPSAPPAPPFPRPSTPAPPSSDSSSDDDDDDDFDDDDDDDDDETSRRKARSHERKPGADERTNRRSGFESLLRDSFRKAVERGLEVGIGTLKSADQVVHKVADEVKMPKEISNYLFSQIDETKNVLIRAVAGEVREFLDTTDLATELQRALTALSFEVRMEIRFIPNEAGELKAKVKTKAVPRARRKEPES
jgi:hypothetical protein